MTKKSGNFEDLGFGHFSTAETENDWLWRSYDGIESASGPIKPLKLEDVEKFLEKAFKSRNKRE